MAKFGFRKDGGHSETHGSKKAMYVVGGIIVVLFLFFLFSAVTDSFNPESCAGCHVIEPYFLTWQNSPHANVGCNDCHVEPGTGLITVVSRRIGERIAYRSDMEVPIEGTREISSAACLQCHSPNRQITPGLDIRGGDWHAEHLGYGTSCVDCHWEVAHAGMSARTAFVPTEERLDDFREMDPHDFSLTKTSCLECHDGQRVTYNCEICHTAQSIPDNHFVADFHYNHGAAVRADIQDCMRCHTGFGRVREIPGISIAEITRNARFCVECHEGVRPVTHNVFWSVGHKIPGAASPDGCMVCHDWNEPVSEMRAADVITCAACHEAVPDGHDDPRWYWDHKDMVRERGSFGCFDCHGATSCFDCHTRENVGFGN